MINRITLLLLIAYCITRSNESTALAQTAVVPPDQELLAPPAPEMPIDPRPTLLAHHDPLIRQAFSLPIENANNATVDTARVINGHLYLAGTRWKEKLDDRFWLWRVKYDGTRAWDLLLDQQRNNIDHLHAIGMMTDTPSYDNRSEGFNIVLLTRRRDETKVNFISEAGQLRHQELLGHIEDVMGVLPVSDEDNYIYGASKNEIGFEDNHAWIARCNHAGRLFWKIPIRFNNELTPPENLPKDTKTFRQCSLVEAVQINPTTIACLGERRLLTSKFGTGPSEVFINTVDREGRILNTRTFPGLRLSPHSRSRIVADETGIVFTWTNIGFEDIVKHRSSGYPIHLTRLNLDLTTVWEREVAFGQMSAFAATTLLKLPIGESTYLLSNLATTNTEQRQQHLEFLWLNETGHLQHSARLPLGEETPTPIISTPDRDDIVTIFLEEDLSTDSRRHKILITRVPSQPVVQPQ